MQYRERIIFLGQAVDEELGNQLVGTILYLDSENHKDMRLYINTFGGDVSHLVLQGLFFAHHLLSPVSKLQSLGSGGKLASISHAEA